MGSDVPGPTSGRSVQAPSSPRTSRRLPLGDQVNAVADPLTSWRGTRFSLTTQTPALEPADGGSAMKPTQWWSERRAPVVNESTPPVSSRLPSTSRASPLIVIEYRVSGSSMDLGTSTARRGSVGSPRIVNDVAG